MAKVSKEIKNKIVEAINNLDENVKDKCSLCNITLTDVVKKIEVATGAPAASVCKVISDVVNENRPEYEKVNYRALSERVRRTEGKHLIDTKRYDKKLTRKKSRLLYTTIYTMVEKNDITFNEEEYDFIIDSFAKAREKDLKDNNKLRNEIGKLEARLNIVADPMIEGKFKIMNDKIANAEDRVDKLKQALVDLGHIDIADMF